MGRVEPISHFLWLIRSKTQAHISSTQRDEPWLNDLGFLIWAVEIVGQQRYLLPSPSGVFEAISTFRPGNGSKKIYLRLAGYKTEKENLRRC